MIIKNGIDVTDEIMNSAEKLRVQALKSDHYRNRFRDATVHLGWAREQLESIKRPWMDDCIHDGIEKISEIIKTLEEKITP